MDATAIGAALIGAVGVVLAAWITARSRQKPPSESPPPQIAYLLPFIVGASDDDEDEDDDATSREPSLAFKLLRGVIWTVVFMLYATGIFSLGEIAFSWVLQLPESKLLMLIFAASAVFSFSLGFWISTFAKRHGL